MASNKPFGARPVGTGSGSPFNGRVNRYYIAQADANAYQIGAFVKSTNTSDAYGTPGVTKAAGTDTMRGIIVGVEYGEPNAVSLAGDVIDRTITSIPATKTRNYYVYVNDDPMVEFEIQDDGITTGNLVAASVNKNCSLTIADPSSAKQASATVLLSSSIATTQGLCIKLIGLAPIPGNAFGAYGIWRARFNQHELMGNTAGL